MSKDRLPGEQSRRQIHVDVTIQGGPKVGLQLFWRGSRNVARLKEDILSTYEIKLC